MDYNPDTYPAPTEDPLVIRDTLFYSRPPGKTRKVKGKPVVLDPFQMVLSKLKHNFKKWETILSENTISLTGNKDHLNACLSYMIYCLTIGKQFNLTYCIAKRMESVTKSDVMAVTPPKSQQRSGIPLGVLLHSSYTQVTENDLKRDV
ncbi:hypothetical protein Tco_0987206 [Tanacetum coccineum]